MHDEGLGCPHPAGSTCCAGLLVLSRWVLLQSIGIVLSMHGAAGV
jgi:hypothetical protein